MREPNVKVPCEALRVDMHTVVHTGALVAAPSNTRGAVCLHVEHTNPVAGDDCFGSLLISKDFLWGGLIL